VHRLSLDLARDGDGSDGGGGGDGQEQQQPQQTSGSWLSKLTGHSGGTDNNKKKKPHPDAKRAYKNHVDHLVAPQCTILYPFEGNLHEFVAGPDGAAILDVLLPPYDEGTDRDCTFYTIHEEDDDGDAAGADIDDGNGEKRQPCWIIPTGQPEDFHCISGRYNDMGA